MQKYDSNDKMKRVNFFHFHDFSRGLMTIMPTLPYTENVLSRKKIAISKKFASITYVPTATE